MDDPTPWVRLKNELLRLIESRILEPGDEVAIVYESRDFGVALKTGEKAFHALVAEGKLIPPAGNGKPYTVA
jgi:DNA-binding GntR family transcriptional regulator